MVGLDDVRLAEAGLDDVRVDGALDEEVHSADLLRLFLEDADELFTDDLPLLLRFGDTLQLLIIPLLGIDADEVEVVRTVGTEDRFDFIALVLAKEAVVHEDAGQLFADRLGQEDRRDGGVDTAGQREEDFAVPDLLADGCHLGLDEGVHDPVALAAAGVADEGADDLGALFRVHDFRVELYRIEALLGVLHGSDRTVFRVGRNVEPFGGFGDVVRVAHPHNSAAGFVTAGDVLAILRESDVFQDALMIVHEDFSFSVFGDRRRFDGCAEEVGHQLGTVADAEDRDAEFEDLLLVSRRGRVVDRVRTAGEDDALVTLGFDLFNGRRIVQDLSVHVLFAHAAGDQLVVLAAEVQDEDGFIHAGIRSSLKNMQNYTMGRA